ncbi:MAG: hypothetical protein WAM58_09900 [Candidatus Acidiferrum sp.]
MKIEKGNWKRGGVTLDPPFAEGAQSGAPGFEARRLIEEGFFPQKTQKGAAFLTARTSFGMTVFFCGESQGAGLKARRYNGKRNPRALA